MNRLIELGILGFTVLLMLSSKLAANDNKVVIEVDGGQRCFLTNGIPDHLTG